MLDVSAFRMLPPTVTSWLDRQEREMLAYLMEENRVVRRQPAARRLRLTDDDRRQLAARAYRLRRWALREVATIVTPDTLLRWHRQVIARKCTDAKKGPTRHGVLAEIGQLVWRMAAENPTWDTRGFKVRSRTSGIASADRRLPGSSEQTGFHPRPSARHWQTFLRAYWGEIVAADFSRPKSGPGTAWSPSTPSL